MVDDKSLLNYTNSLVTPSKTMDDKAELLQITAKLSLYFSPSTSLFIFKQLIRR